jgi:glycosyltransferase involved in cell wall biosynthesis
MAVLEAMAAGVPVVASAVGELPRLDRGAVVLVEPGSAEELRRGVRAVLGDQRRRRELAERGRDLVRVRFSSSRMRSDYGSIYDNVRHMRRSS